MDRSNDWNSSFWIDELAKLAEDSKFAISPETDSNETSDSDESSKTKTIEDLEDIKKLNHTKETAENSFSNIHTLKNSIDLGNPNCLDKNVNDPPVVVNLSGTNSAIYSNETKEFNFSFPIKEHTIRNAGNYDSNNEDPQNHKNSSKSSNITKKTKPFKPFKSFKTEFIYCSLSDLISDTTSPVIEAAVLKMEEEGKRSLKQQQRRTYASFLEEQSAQSKSNQEKRIIKVVSIKEEKTKGNSKLSTNAKEFVPFSFNKKM